jgi:purine-binding chemotaxis protein CheW
MSDERSRLADRAEALRLAFDRSFAEERRGDTPSNESLLAFDLGAEPYALRLSEIAGIFVDRKITRLPGGATALLGFAGFRGAIVPAYDLHVLLGRAPTETPRWLALASGAPVALAFETFAGHMRVPREAILPRDGDDQPGRLARDVASADGVVRPIVHLASVIDTILKQRPRTNLQEER